MRQENNQCNQIQDSHHHTRDRQELNEKIDVDEETTRRRRRSRSGRKREKFSLVSARKSEMFNHAGELKIHSMQTKEREERTCLTCTWMNIPNEKQRRRRRRRIERFSLSNEKRHARKERRRSSCSPKREDKLEGNWPHEFLSIDISFGVATRESCSSCPFDLLGSILSVEMESYLFPLMNVSDKTRETKKTK